MPMNPEIKARWVAALRSGEYQQAKGQLTTSVTDANGNEHLSHCCLGVLCEILPKIKATRHRRRVFVTDSPDGPQEQYAYGAEGAVGSLPWAVIAAAGLDSDDPVVVENGWSLELSTLNDRFCYDFNRLADLIEAQL